MGFGRAGSRLGALGSALGALLLVSLGVILVLSAAAFAAPGGNSAATITASPFTDSCRDVSFRSSKDISHVEIHYADGRVVKDETIDSPDYSIDGGPGDEIDFVNVKSGTTREIFACPRTNSPPTAVLERKAGNFDPQNPSGTWTNADCQPPCRYTIPAGGDVPDESAVSFRGTSSTDPDNDIVSWSIDFGDETTTASGSWTTKPPAEVVHDYGIECICTVTLTVTDSAGNISSDSMFVTMVFVDRED